MAFYFVEQPFLAMESAFPNPRFCRQQRSRRMPRCTNSMDQLMEEARRQVLLEQNRTSEAFAMQDFLGVMNGIVDGFLKDQQQHQSDVEKNSNSENDSSATPRDESNQDDQVPKKEDCKENAADAECPKQKCSHPGPLKDYFAAIDAIVNAMSKNQHQKTDEENSNQSENSSDKNADRSKDNIDITDDEQQHPMKDFLTVMDTIVGTLMNPHRNGNSNSEKKATDNKTEVDKLSGGNVDNNVVDQTIKIKTPAASAAAAEKDEPKKLAAAAAATENEVKEVLKNQV